jgi:DNA-binding transcriptional ArsR family regulator
MADRSEDDQTDLVFRALADPIRRRLLDRLHAEAGLTLTALCQDLDITRQSTSQHLAVLEAAGLITTIKRGRDKLHYLNRVPIDEISRRWIAKFQEPDLAALARLKQALEHEQDSS